MYYYGRICGVDYSQRAIVMCDYHVDCRDHVAPKRNSPFAPKRNSQCPQDGGQSARVE